MAAPPPTKLQAKVRRWTSRALTPSQLRLLRHGLRSGALRSLAGTEEWQFVYAMHRIYRNQKSRLPSHLHACALQIVNQVSNIYSPIPEAWVLSHPEGALAPAQRAALRQLLKAPSRDVGGGGGTPPPPGALLLPPWIENVPPPRAPRAMLVVPKAAGTQSSTPSQNHNGLDSFSVSPADAPAVRSPRCMGRCVWSTRILGNHPGCPLLRPQTELRCSNTAESKLEYMPHKNDSSGAPAHAQHTLSVDSEADQPELRKYEQALMPGYEELARREAKGHVWICHFCQRALQKDARVHSPLSLLSLGFRKLEDVATTAHAYGQKAAYAGNSLASMGADTLGKSMVRAGKFIQNSSESVSPTLQATGAVKQNLQKGLRLFGVDTSNASSLSNMASDALMQNVSNTVVNLAKSKLGVT